MSSQSWSATTHSGKVDAALFLANGLSEDKVSAQDGRISIDWYAKKCVLSLNTLKVECALDISQDLKNDTGELVMKEMPQVKISSVQLSELYRGLARDAKKNGNLYQNVVDEAGEVFKNGLSIPFYTCGDCSKTGKDLVLYNVFQSFVSRSHQVGHAYLNGKKLVLKVTLKEIKANPGSFHVIGNNNQGNFSD